MAENVQMTLSITVAEEGQVATATRILTDALVLVVTQVDDLIAASVSLYRDDFLEQEAEAKSAEGDVHIVASSDTDVESLVRQASTVRGPSAGEIADKIAEDPR